MSRSRIIRILAPLVAVPVLGVSACTQAPTTPPAVNVQAPTGRPPSFDDDSLTCINGYSVSNGIVSCNLD